MARPSRSQALDLSEPIDLTTGAIERLACPTGKEQAFLRDAKAPGLRVRVTAKGAKSFVFEAKLGRQTIRRTIGDVRAWRLDAARAEAFRLRVAVDGGHDPRELDRQREEAKAAASVQSVKESVTVGDAWKVYLRTRKPKWGVRHYADHEKLAQEGGKETSRGTRGTGKTKPGPLHALLAMKLSDLTPEAIEAWAAQQGAERKTYGRLAWRCLKAFIAWCSEEADYKAIVVTDAAKTRKTREAFGKAGQKKDVLLKEQLPAWFTAVRALPSPATAAYLQTLLLIGSRRGELLALKWTDINERWKGLVIRDKVEGEREIPLTPYVWSLLSALPRTNAYVFASVRKANAHLTDPNGAMTDACKAAKVEGLTLHGLRRSFKSLTEWLDIPAGVVAQIMGHKPSATAEKHYTIRPLDLVRVHHERIEGWILQQAGIQFPPPKQEAAEPDAEAPEK